MRIPELEFVDVRYRDLVAGYLSAAMFTEDPKPGQGEYNPPWDTLPAVTIAQAFTDCARFYDSLTPALQEVVDTAPDHAGRDFWYTRNGHGCGFWDGDWDDPEGSLLTAHSKMFGECCATMDNGYLEFM